MKKHYRTTGLIISILYLLCIFYLMRNCFVDDAHIGFRVIENALDGHGFVFNPGDRVEAVTNIGWLLFLAPMAFIIPLDILAKSVSLVSIILTIIILMQTGKKLLPKKQQWLISAYPLLLVIQFDYIFFSLGGMETALLALVLSVILYLYSNDRYPFLIVLLGAWICLIRPETIVIYPAILLLNVLFKPTKWRKGLLLFTSWSVTLAAFELIRYYYFGAWLPNTFASKPGLPLAVILDRFIHYGFNIPNVSASFTGPLIIVFMVLTFFAVPKNQAAKISLLVMTGCGYLFAIYAPTDWTLTGRYFAPYIPFAVLLAFTGASYLYNYIVDNLPAKRIIIQYLTVAVLFFYVFINAAGFIGYFRPGNLEAYPQFVMVSEKLISPAIWIKVNTPPNSVIASRRIGALGRYSDRYIFDYTWGLPHRDIAALIKKYHRAFDSPNSDLLSEIWHEKSPDYLLEDTEKIPFPNNVKTDTCTIQGEQFVVYKKFKLNKERDWILLKKIAPLKTP